jgi:hypothetical protein
MSLALLRVERNAGLGTGPVAGTATRLIQRDMVILAQGAVLLPPRQHPTLSI